MATGWIAVDRLKSPPSGTKVVRRMDRHALVEHVSIPHEADHVDLIDGAFVMIPHPDAS